MTVLPPCCLCGDLVASEPGLHMRPKGLNGMMRWNIVQVFCKTSQPLLWKPLQSTNSSHHCHYPKRSFFFCRFYIVQFYVLGGSHWRWRRRLQIFKTGLYLRWMIWMGHLSHDSTASWAQLQVLCWPSWRRFITPGINARDFWHRNVVGNRRPRSVANVRQIQNSKASLV